jgi:hypothetical protein
MAEKVIKAGVLMHIHTMQTRYSRQSTQHPCKTGSASTLVYRQRARSFIAAIIITLLFVIATPVDQSLAQNVRHEIFLANTDHELHVYRISGDEPGKTIMLVGGIQGDEPGGYMTADLYADVHLKKGNLIVVPRANFYSILLNRRDGLTGDMNRKFAPGSETYIERNLEEEIVAILKHLISESDCLLNLHEGSGFYNPVWIDDQENPQRFGQSIIYDTALFAIHDEGKIIHLEALANRVIDLANKQIDDKRLHFKPNNNNTLAEQTQHPEQRKSATFYALTREYIPAFGIETSKSIKNLETKMHLQKLVINMFMQEFGIVIDTPGVVVDNPRLNYLLIKINGGPAYAMGNQSTLEINPGDDILITDIIANYERGLVADILDYGSANDMNISFRMSKPTRIIVKKDAIECGWIDLRIKELPENRAAAPSESDIASLRAEEITVNVDGQMKSVALDATLAVPRGARLILNGVKTNISRLDSDVFLNLKGFAPPTAQNNGNDLFFPIYTNQDLLERYSENQMNKRYPIEANYNDKQIGLFWIELTDP